MRRSVLFLTALFAMAPVTPFDTGDSTAAAAERRSPRKKKSSRPQRKKPAEIKLNETTTQTPEAPEQASAPPQRGPTRIDFDDRLIQGQTNQSGSVYLYDRKELKTRSMVRKRESFREEIVKTVYDE